MRLTAILPYFPGELQPAFVVWTRQQRLIRVEMRADVLHIFNRSQWRNVLLILIVIYS